MKIMRQTLLTIAAACMAMTALADGYDQGVPFGFCTVQSRTDAAQTYNMTGGGCYTYPIPDDFTGKVITLKSNGQDMKGTIQNAIKQNDVVILDGADGDFIVSENIGITSSNRTVIGINNARVCTKWYLTPEIIKALSDAGVPSMSTSSGTGGTLPNGQSVSEEAEYNTRRIIIEMTDDNNENYRKSGCVSLVNCQNVIIRNITFQGPGSVDVGGNDLISSTGAKNIWVDHCTFQDGMDGNFDITQKADFHTVSWCVFRYTDRSFMHQNTNLIGSSDSETKGFLNTTFAFNWWATGCKQRMPLGRVGKIHMLNNYYSCATASLCMNPRKNSEFLIEGNNFASSVKNCYKNDGATAVTWAADNIIGNASVSTPSSTGTVSVPYTYTVAAANAVPDEVQANAGATLSFGGGGEEPTGTKGSVYWPLSADVKATISDAISDGIESTTFSCGLNLVPRTQGTYGEVRFTLFQAQTIQDAAAEDNGVGFAITTKSGYTFTATEVELYACKVGTNNGSIDISWTDAGGTTALVQGLAPNRNNAENNYHTYINKDISGIAKATEGTCQLTVNIYNVGAMKDGALQLKDLGLAQVNIKGFVTDGITTVEKPVTISLPLSTEYFDAAGQQVDAPTEGLVILRQRMTDGTVKTVKMVNR